MKQSSIAMESQPAQRVVGQQVRMSRPSSPDSIDFAIRALGGNTETLELWKLPSKAVAASPQQRIAELEEEKNWLRLDINAECQKYKLLLALVPALRSQVDQLQRMVEEYDAEIQEVCKSWEASKGA
ncbi:hypothetical protein NQ176_g2197 [Zarea fungicola]|uniref:Uncharacterized protein n=1 Tax=Zarea fungicola TaxID=93591 RepID=A0ACC1NP87_9HYPO|nr:hypothetical protein NQ176_g2197 [Lecanicillium fungicola]